jgi:hypothetical protein
MILSLLISFAFAADSTPTATPAPSATPSSSVMSKATVYSALEKAPAKTPLGGSFAEGEKLLRSADPENEANIVFNERGVSTISVCGFACLAPGIDAKESVKGPSIPATSDALNELNKGYNEAATDFATRFNKQMIARKSPKAKGESPIHKELPAKELTVGGVTIGKSNLYNAVGFFGTNMFKKEKSGGDSLSIICWKGSDGTTLAFESGQGGGREQTVTGVRLFAAGLEYEYSAECKTSKKVSALLELAGMKLGESSADVEKKRGAPSDRGTDRMMWHYLHETKKKSVTTDVEVSAPEEKVKSISVSRLQEH